MREGAVLPFADVAASAWYYDAVSYVYANGLMDGVSAVSFNPDGAMTRAMVLGYSGAHRRGDCDRRGLGG